MTGRTNVILALLILSSLSPWSSAAHAQAQMRPDVNGLELIHFIRRSEQYRSTPLVIISTQATERDVERGKKLGADAYVPKPFTPEALREACARVLVDGPGNG